MFSQLEAIISYSLLGCVSLLPWKQWPQTGDSSTSRPSVSSMIAADIGKAINSILKRYEDENDFVTQAPPRKKTKYGRIVNIIFFLLFINYKYYYYKQNINSTS